MTVIGALSSFRKRREMSPHKRPAGQRIGHRITLFAAEWRPRAMAKKQT
jgi:hypothetical protein